MREDSKRVPFCNMIYIGDGLSDVPYENGESLRRVFQCSLPKKGQQGRGLADERTGWFIYPADYSENTSLDLTVKNIIRKMAVCGLFVR